MPLIALVANSMLAVVGFRQRIIPASLEASSLSNIAIQHMMTGYRELTSLMTLPLCGEFRQPPYFV